MHLFNWFSRSLSRQVSTVLVFIIFAVLIGCAIHFYNVQSQLLQRSTQQMVKQLVSSLNSSSGKNLHFNDQYAAWINIRNQMQNYRRQIGDAGLFSIDEIALIDTNGITFAHSAPADNPLQRKYSGTLPDKNALASAADGILFTPVEINGVEGIRIYSQVEFQGHTVGTMILQLDLSLSVSQQHALIIDFAKYIIIVLLMAIIFGMIFGRWVSKPLSIIESSLEQIGSGQLKLPELQNRHDEYKELAVALEQADKNLNQSQTQVHLLLDSTAEAIYGLDVEGNCTFVNQACLDMLGYIDDSRLLGHNMHKLIHHSHKDGTHYPIEECHIYRAFKKQLGTHIDDEVLWREDGSYFAAEYWSHPVFIEHECVGAVVTFLDITERLEAQQKLQERERGLALTLDSIGDAVIVTDIEGNITRMNRVAVGLTGWSVAEARGRPLPMVFQIINEETRKSVADPVEKVLHTGEVVDLVEHTVLISKDGTEYLISDSAAPIIDEHEKILGVILVFRDVTQQYQTEDALRRSQKMDAIGQLSGGIAHDFNNQLGIIVGYLDFLSKHLAEEDKPKKWVDISTNATLRCMDLTRQLLSFSRTKSNKKVVVDINAKLRELETMFSRSVTPAVDVEYSLAENVWLTEIDPGEFQDAILNLVINSRDAMPDGGKLLIETSNIYLDEDYVALNPDAQAGDYVQLLLSDNGSGMDKNTQEHVFEPFYTTKPKDKGTGLGMSMVYGFIKRFNGFIKIYSEVNVGTTLRLYLPRAGSDKVSNSQPAKNQKLPGGNEAILIVDDEVDLLYLADKYLTDLGYRTYQAENASQALAILAEHKDIDCLFTDVVMPGGINGYELAQRATEDKPSLKVLITTGFTSKTVTKKGRILFPTQMLSKPYRKTDLAQHIRLTLDQKNE
jgi:PAS domain S-box-containing protein